jgi:hypothetical protein
MIQFAAAGAFLRRIPAWVWVAVFCLAGIWLYGRYQYQQGEEQVKAEWAASVERGKKQVERLKAEAGKITVKVETKYVERIKEVKIRGETIVKQVPVYVPAGLPQLPGSVRVFVDAASQGALPDPTKTADAAPVPIEDLATSVAENYTQCLATSEQLRGLQEWVIEQHKLNPGE